MIIVVNYCYFWPVFVAIMYILGSNRMAFLISVRAGKTKVFLNFHSIGIVTSKTNAPYVISYEISYDVMTTYYPNFTLSNPLLKSNVKDLTQIFI